jgi:hypothetical protein
LRKLIYCFFLFTLYSCEQNIPSYDDLSSDEQDYIRTIAESKCRSDLELSIANFKENSNEQMASYVRGQYWKLELSKGTTVQSTDYIYVWEVDGVNVYFLLQETSRNGYEYKFYKMNQEYNSDMIDDLVDKKCTKTYSMTISDSQIAITFTDKQSYEPPTSYKSDLTYTASSSTPVFFGLYNFSQAKKKLDDDGDVVSTENYTYKATYVGNDAKLNPLYTDYENEKYCLIDYANGSTPGTKDLTFPYTDNSCTTEIAGPTNPGTDTDLNFPASELEL